MVQNYGTLLDSLCHKTAGVSKVWDSRVFHKHTEMAIMTILASEALLHENKKKLNNKNV